MPQESQATIAFRQIPQSVISGSGSVWRKIPLFVRDDNSLIACHFERSEKSFLLRDGAELSMHHHYLIS
jgi:hypothetical protein